MQGNKEQAMRAAQVKRVMFETTIQGIPCGIIVTNCTQVKGSYSYHAASDWDYYGYTEFDFEVYDRKGYKAEWLARKITDQDMLRIQEEYLTASQDY